MIEAIAKSALDIYTSRKLCEFIEAYACPYQNFYYGPQNTPQRV
jgi:hypothetical protein